MNRLILGWFLTCVAEAVLAVATPREHISLNADWRLTKGDPTNRHSNDLLYDIRPVSMGEDQKERLAEATAEAAKLSTAVHPVLKPWILPGPDVRPNHAGFKVRICGSGSFSHCGRRGGSEIIPEIHCERI